MMRRKSSMVLAKLMCMGVILGTYHFWNRDSSSGKHDSEHELALTRSAEHGEINGVENGRAVDAADLDVDSIRAHMWYSDSRNGASANWRWISGDSRAAARHLLGLVNCTPRAVEQFPRDFLTPEQRKSGLLVIHAVIACYMFVALALVCDRYFVPALEVLCEILHVETDVAGATFMAAGSSAPELATAIIGVFVAKDDVGLGTVVGSAIYNVMFVISMCGLFALSAIKLHWWPMVRDCIAYLISIIALVVIIYDEMVVWYEAVALNLLYVLYVVFMYFNEKLEVYCVPRCTTCCRKSTREIQTETSVLYSKMNSNGEAVENAVETPTTHLTEPRETTHLTEARESDEEENADDSPPSSVQTTHAHQEAESFHKLCERPQGIFWTFLWLISLPLSTLMFLTVPDCRRPSCRKWFLVTFLLSLVWLSLYSFVMVWMITIIGFTLNIPDSVMSLTFIAFGVSLPDVVTSVIVVRDGLGDMAVSNAIGSNVFDILICLGIPWFLETCVKDPGSYVQVYSQGLVYSSIMLLSTVLFLLVATHFNGWRLTKKYGIVLLVVYVLYNIAASMYELNFFGYVHPPECPSSY